MAWHCGWHIRYPVVTHVQLILLNGISVDSSYNSTHACALIMTPSLVLLRIFNKASLCFVCLCHCLTCIRLFGHTLRTWAVHSLLLHPDRMIASVNLCLQALWMQSHTGFFEASLVNQQISITTFCSRFRSHEIASWWDAVTKNHMNRIHYLYSLRWYIYDTCSRYQSLVNRGNLCWLGVSNFTYTNVPI